MYWLRLSLASFFVASAAPAAVIPANALVNFQVQASASAGNGPYTTHVDAWKNTGLLLNAGDLFALEASGSIWVAPPFTPERAEGPDGGIGDCPGCVAPSATRYALVGKIGTDLGDEFFVGSSFSGVANDTGYLYLAMNDNYYPDNIGSFTVSTAPIPEPSTALLLGFGLAGLAGRARRLSDRPAGAS